MLFRILPSLEHPYKDVLEALQASSFQNSWKRDKIKYKLIVRFREDEII